MQSMLLPIAVMGIPVTLLIVVFIILERKRKKRRLLLTQLDSLSNSDREIVIREANKRLAANPRDAVALRTLAEMHFKGEDYQKALINYKILVEGTELLSHDSADIFLNFGITAMKCKEWATAHSALKMAQKDSPDNLEVLVNLGITYYMLKKYTAAVTTLQQALKMNPSYGLTLKYLGQSLFYLKRHTEALHHLKQATMASPEDNELMYIRARCEYEENRMDSALTSFQKLRTIPPWGIYACLYVGHIHVKRKQWQEAAENYQMGLKYDNIDAKILLELKYSLVRSFCYTNQLEEGAEIAQEIYAVNPEYKDIKKLLAQCTALNTNKNLRVYLKASVGEFRTLAYQIIQINFKKKLAKLYDQYTSTNDYIELMATLNTAQGECLTLICFIRNEGQTGELFVREFHSRMKENHAVQGVCFSPGYYSIEARHFIEARTIELLDKQKLLEVLKQCR